MMCQRIGRPPISTIGFGRISVSPRDAYRVRRRGSSLARPRYYGRLHDDRCRNRNDESPAARAIGVLLAQDLVGEIPGEQKRVADIRRQKMLRRLDGNMGPGCEETVF